MTDDTSFLRAVIASPEDETPRLVYADWLEERGDPRAELLRSDWNLPRLSFVDWVAQRGDVDFYLRQHKELRPRLKEWHANRWWRERVQALGDAVDPVWLAQIDTLGRPFQPFFFWNNTGPRAFQEGELPFLETIGTRGPVVTFESSFRGEEAWQPGLDEDLAFLCNLTLDECAYGAASCPVHPFLCELEDDPLQLSGARILRALKAKGFRSEHIRSLEAYLIPYPGHHGWTDNDEIHTDPAEQHLFLASPDAMAESGELAVYAAHDALRAVVDEGTLWYVLLHNWSGEPDDDRGPWVVLFAVGRSLRGKRLIGVVTHQGCHNFCN